MYLIVNLWHLEMVFKIVVQLLQITDCDGNLILALTATVNYIHKNVLIINNGSVKILQYNLLLIIMLCNERSRAIANILS